VFPNSRHSKSALTPFSFSERLRTRRKFISFLSTISFSRACKSLLQRDRDTICPQDKPMSIISVTVWQHGPDPNLLDYVRNILNFSTMPSLEETPRRTRFYTAQTYHIIPLTFPPENPFSKLAPSPRTSSFSISLPNRLRSEQTHAASQISIVSCPLGDAVLIVSHCTHPYASIPTLTFRTLPQIWHQGDVAITTTFAYVLSLYYVFPHCSSRWYRPALHRTARSPENWHSEGMRRGAAV
jgi:hypothetical protein